MSDTHAEGNAPGQGGGVAAHGALRFVLPSGMAMVPVEVRRPDMTLARRVHSAETVEGLPEGSYFVTALLPSGENIVAQAQVKASTPEVDKGSEATTVVLAPVSAGLSQRLREVPDDTGNFILESMGPSSDDDESHPANETFMARQEQALADLPRSVLEAVNRESLSLPRQRLVTASLGTRLSAAHARDSLAPDSGALRMYLFAGNPLKRGKCRPIAPTPLRSVMDPNGSLLIRVGGDSQQFLHLRQEGHRPINIALPTSSEASCEVVARHAAGSDGADEVTLDIHLENPRANMLLRYLTANRYSEADALAPDAQAAADLLSAKLKDPIAAAVGGYTLLALNRMTDTYGEWLGNLSGWFPRLPDGAALHGEYLARNGRHEEALAAFISLEERGLPLFSDGLQYATERLSLYARLLQQKPRKGDDFGRGMAKRVRRLQERLSRFQVYTDFHQSLLYFRGLVPDRPGNEPAPPRRKDPRYLRRADLDLTTLMVVLDRYNEARRGPEPPDPDPPFKTRGG